MPGGAGIPVAGPEPGAAGAVDMPGGKGIPGGGSGIPGGGIGMPDL